MIELTTVLQHTKLSRGRNAQPNTIYYYIYTIYYQMSTKDWFHFEQSELCKSPF